MADNTKTAAHTAGPWHPVSRAGYSGHGVADRDGKSICSISPQSKRPKDERDANARLIAAAPELLVALEKLMACCEEHPAFTKTSNTITFGRMNAARAAIAAAKAEPANV